MELTSPPGDAVLPVEPVVGQIEPEAITTGTALTYSSGNIGTGVFSALNLYFLPSFLNPLLKGIPFGLIINNILSSTHSFEGTLIQPLVGAWSDRTWSQRWGRRRIFAVRFLPLTVLLLAVTPFLPRLQSLVGLPQNVVVLLVAASIFVFSIAFNVMNDPYGALMADITPQRQRGWINGIFQAFGAFGQVAFIVAGLLVLGNLPWEASFIVAGLIIAVSFLPVLFRIREPRELAGTHKDHRYSLRDYWNGVRRDPQITRYFLVQLFLWIGINAISVNITLYAANELHLDKGSQLLPALVLLLSTALTYLPLIALVHRIGLKSMYIFGVVLMAIASIAAIFTKDVALTLGILAFAGIGNAAQTVASYPLLTRIVFPDQMGLYTGLNTAVTSISAPVSAVIAGSLITEYSFNALFPFLAVMFVLSIIPLVLLNVDRSHAALSLKAATATQGG